MSEIHGLFCLFGQYVLEKALEDKVLVDQAKLLLAELLLMSVEVWRSNSFEDLVDEVYDALVGGARVSPHDLTRLKHVFILGVLLKLLAQFIEKQLLLLYLCGLDAALQMHPTLNLQLDSLCQLRVILYFVGESVKGLLDQDLLLHLEPLSLLLGDRVFIRYLI